MRTMAKMPRDEIWVFDAAYNYSDLIEFDGMRISLTLAAAVRP